MDISLVLGSGGARGYAHIGVIEVLLKHNYTIKSISGSSMGALVGGLYACGKLDEFKEWVLTIDALDMIKLVDLSFSKMGLIQGDKVFAKLEEFIGDVMIEDLSIPYTAVATDIVKQKEVWLKEGRLIDAIRASMAIPTLFTPKQLDGRLLVDGGVLNPIPVAPTIYDKTDLTIAVGLYSKEVKEYKVNIPQKEKEKSINIKDNFSKLLQKANDLIPIKSQNKDKDKDKLEQINARHIMANTIDTMQSTINNYKLAGNPPDIEINILKSACEFYEFNRAYELIEIGRLTAQDILSKK